MPQYTQTESRNSDDGRIYIGVESKVLKISNKYSSQHRDKFRVNYSNTKFRDILFELQNNDTFIRLLWVSSIERQSEVEQKIKQYNKNKEHHIA